MTVRIRPAALDSDRKVLIETVFRHLTPLSDERRYDWLYRENPHGQARAWVAYGPDSSTIVGMAAAFPRRLLVGGVEKLGWVLGDFCMSAGYRSLGPALELQRTCLTELDSGGTAIFYDFPSERMMAIYRRLGFPALGHMVRLAKPLRADRKIGEFVRFRSVARSLSRLANWMLLLRDRAPRDIYKCTTSLHQGACGEEFSSLARRVSARYRMCVQRSAEYLNWRYLSHPHQRYEILAARAQSTLMAYAVFTQNGENATIVDVFGLDEVGPIGSLIARVVAILRERGVVTVSAPLLAWHPWVELFVRMGFRPREASPVVVYPAVEPAAAHDAAGGPKWFLMAGDRDG